MFKVLLKLQKGVHSLKKFPNISKFSKISCIFSDCPTFSAICPKFLPKFCIFSQIFTKFSPFFNQIFPNFVIKLSLPVMQLLVSDNSFALVIKLLEQIHMIVSILVSRSLNCFSSSQMLQQIKLECFVLTDTVPNKFPNVLD
jgi:hypothetical protein